MEAKVRQVRLLPEYANIPVLESFINTCDFLPQDAKNRLTLIATEIFDNIVTHNRFPFRKQVSLWVRADSCVRLRISYGTCNFGEMIRANRTVAPHFDRDSGRYRGIGLRMCRNLAATVRFRRGLCSGTILITL